MIEHAKASIPMRISFRVGRLDIKNGEAQWKMYVDDEQRKVNTSLPSGRFTNARNSTSRVSSILQAPKNGKLLSVLTPS